MKRFKIVNGKAVTTHVGPNTCWNGLSAPAKIVRVVVAEVPDQNWWCAKLAGTTREAVQVTVPGGVMFLDNEAFGDHEAGAAWLKVTAGRGSPRYGHRTLPVRNAENYL